MPSINVVPLRKAAPKRTHLTQERTEPFLDNSAAGFITVGNMTSCPGSSCPVPCLPASSGKEPSGGSNMPGEQDGRSARGEEAMYRVPPSPRLHVGISAQPVWERATTELGLHTHTEVHLSSIHSAAPRASITVAILPTSCVAVNPPVNICHCPHHNCNTAAQRYRIHTCTLYITLTHTHAHQGHIVHCSTSCFFPTQRLHGPKTARWRCTYRPCLSLRSQAQGSLESVPR